MHEYNFIKNKVCIGISSYKIVLHASILFTGVMRKYTCGQGILFTGRNASYKYIFSFEKVSLADIAIVVGITSAF